MEAPTVLLIAVPILLGLAVLLVVATTVSRQRSASGSLGRETKKADRSSTELVPGPDLDEEARARFEETKQSLEPAGAKPATTTVGGLVRFGEAPADPEALGVTRRQFFNRGIIAAQSLALGSFSLAVIGFLWPSQAGGFGGEVRVPDRLREVLDLIAERREPYYVPEARSYLVPYPEAALPRAEGIYPDQILSGMQEGVVALYQKCPHLGCRVPWCHSSQWFECPCHGSKYNRVGEKTGGPAPRGMDHWPVEVAADGSVTINTSGEAIQGASIGVNTTRQEAEGPSCV